MLRWLWLVLALIAPGLPPAAHAQMADGQEADSHPIIAQLYHDPARYAGRRVVIYGLVVEQVSPAIFMLQDVSQRPLKIVGNARLTAKVGDQLIVVGLFRSAPDGPYLSAMSLIKTQVTGGGGCC